MANTLHHAPDYEKSAALAGWEKFGVALPNGDLSAHWMSPDDNDACFESAEELCLRFGVPLFDNEGNPA